MSSDDERELTPVHLIPGWPVAPVCTGPDCKICKLQAKAMEAMAEAYDAEAR